MNHRAGYANNPGVFYDHHAFIPQFERLAMTISLSFLGDFPGIGFMPPLNLFVYMQTP